MSFKSGHKTVPLSPRISELCTYFSGRKGTIQLQPHGWTYYEAFTKFADKYYDFEFFDDDIVLMTMPKSGTTWTLEVIWTIRHNLNFDNPAAKMPLGTRAPILEGDFPVANIGSNPKALQAVIAEKFPDYDQSQGLYLKAAEVAPKPRLLKTHLPFPILHPTLLDKAKVVYVVRDPRDLCLSFQHHSRIFKHDGFKGIQSEFVDAFIEGAVNWGPYWSHVKQAWEKRNHPNLHFIFYDEMKRDPKPVLRKLANFLGVEATDEQLLKVIEYTSFSSMKKRGDHVIPASDAKYLLDMEKVEREGGFFRKGLSGDWKNTLTQQEKEKFDAWIKENCPDPEIMKRINGE